MLKTTGSSVASAFRVDDDEVVGGGDGAEAESDGSVCQQIHQTIQVTRSRSKTSWKSADIRFASEGLTRLQTTKRVELFSWKNVRRRPKG